MSDNNDQLQLRKEKCTYIPEKNIWIGYCEYQNFNKKRNNSIFIIGNSWAANQAPIVFQECHRNTGNLAAQVLPSCEVLFQTKKYGCGDLFTNDVQRVSPDQLFIIARAVQFEEKRDMPTMIEAVAAASKKLALLSTFVKDKIFILNVFPCFSQKVASKLNEAIDKGTTPNYTDLLKNEEGTLAARLAMKDVVRNCPKCVLYDYVPSFEFNGTVLPYDPVNFVSYMTKGQHLTTAGLESIRHVYKEICTKI